MSGYGPAQLFSMILALPQRDLGFPPAAADCPVGRDGCFEIVPPTNRLLAGANVRNDDGKAHATQNRRIWLKKQNN